MGGGAASAGGGRRFGKHVSNFRVAAPLFCPIFCPIDGSSADLEVGLDNGNRRWVRLRRELDNGNRRCIRLRRGLIKAINGGEPTSAAGWRQAAVAGGWTLHRRGLIKGSKRMPSFTTRTAKRPHDGKDKGPNQMHKANARSTRSAIRTGHGRLA